MQVESTDSSCLRICCSTFPGVCEGMSASVSLPGPTEVPLLEELSGALSTGVGSYTQEI